VAPSSDERSESQDLHALPAPGTQSMPDASRGRQPWLQAGRPTLLPRHFAWRLLLLRFLVNAVSLALTAIIVPHIFFAGNYRILTWLLVSAAFGLLNAFIKPLVQVVMLPFMFVSYGLVVVLINAIMLWILDFVFPTRFAVDHLLWALVGGIVFGLLSGFLENLLGLTPPIFEGRPEALKEEIDRRKHGIVETQILEVTEERCAQEHPMVPSPTNAEGEDTVVVNDAESQDSAPGPTETAAP
jgi:putative membrane protein